MYMEHISKSVLQVCREKLIEAKSDILNRLKHDYMEYQSRDRGGDETDLALDMLAESQFLTNQDRMRKRLIDIEMALAKISAGNYGICEETEEPIEVERLLAIPWTRLSVEGAEIREDVSKRFAK